MNGELFYWVLNMSIAGTVIGGITVLLQKIPRIPRRLSFMLWCIPLVRLWIPFGTESRYSLLNLVKQLTVRPVQYIEFKRLRIEAAYTNMIGAAQDYFPIIYKTNAYEAVFSTAEIIWLVVALAAVLAGIGLYLITWTEVRSAEHIRDNIYRSDKVTSPMVFGVVRPRIILPKLSDAFGFEDESDGEAAEQRIWTFDREDDYVLLHEQIHIRRKDNLWRILAVITCCLHWFNPFIWLFLKRFFTDLELACDEKVISICGEENRKKYAAALIDWEEQRTVFASAFGGAKIRVRIEKILSYKRLTVFSAIGFVVLTAVVAVALLTNAVG